MSIALILFFLFLPFQFALSPLPGIDLAVARIAAVVLGIFWIERSLIKRSLWIPQSFQAPLLLTFCALSLLSLLWADMPEWGMRKFLFLISFLPLFFVAADKFRKPSTFFSLSRALIYGASVAGAIGIFQFFLQAIFSLDTILNFWTQHILPIFLGQTFAQAVAQYPSLLVNIGGHTLLRATGLFPDPHMFSFFVGMILPLALGLALTQNHHRKRFFVLASLLFLADCLTFSRGGYIGLIAGSLAFIASLSFKYKQYTLNWKWPVAASLPIICLSLLFIQPFTDRLLSSFQLEEGSNQGRLAMWKTASQIIADHPLTGVGLGNYPLAVKPSASYREPIYAHSLYLDIAAELGLPTLVVFLILLTHAGISLYKKSATEPFLLYPLISLIIFSTHSLVETPLYSVHILPLFLIILAMSTYHSQNVSLSSQI